MNESNAVLSDGFDKTDPKKTYHRPIIILTPVKGDVGNLMKLDMLLQRQLKPRDQWVIVFDHQKPLNIDFKCKNQIEIIENYEKPGAGNSRNIGLRYIKKEYQAPFILYPLDSDDLICVDALKKIRLMCDQYKEKILSFGHIKAWGSKTVKVCYEGKYNLEQLLKRYITPCGSTVLKIDEKAELDNLKFGHRIRANDQIFFLSAVKSYGSFRCIPEIILTYQINNKNSISFQKHKMPKYKYLSLRDFGLGRLSAAYYMIFYAVNGVLRHIFKLGM